jgi:hypothetical protein
VINWLDEAQTMHEFELLSHWAHRQPSDPAPVKTFSRNMHLTSFVPVVRGHQLRNNLPRRPTRAQRARATPARVVQVSADTEQGELRSPTPSDALSPPTMTLWAYLFAHNVCSRQAYTKHLTDVPIRKINPRALGLRSQRLTEWVALVVFACNHAETAPWEFGRFVKTVMTFQPPPTPDQVVQGLMERAFGKPEPKSALVPLKGAEGVDAKAGIVMVVGATGGVGKRVVERLLARG